jgi:Family of unknown function (DUF6069)
VPPADGGSLFSGNRQVGIMSAMSYREPYLSRFGRDGAVDGRKLWTGGIVTAVIIFGLTIAGFLIVGGLLDYPVLGVGRGGAVVHATMFGYAAGAALAALLATAVMHFLLLTTPRPRYFFGWIGGVCTAIAVLMPLALSQNVCAGLATATVNLILGLAIIGLVRTTAGAS